MTGSRRPWAFKFRKPSFTVRKVSDSAPGDGTITEVCAPELCDRLTNSTALIGSTTVLECSLQRGTRHASALWRKTSPDARLLCSTDRYSITMSKDGLARLIIKDCRTSDSGVYSCSISNELGSVQSSCKLVVENKADDNKIDSEYLPNPNESVSDEISSWEQQQLHRR